MKKTPRLFVHITVWALSLTGCYFSTSSAIDDDENFIRCLVNDSSFASSVGVFGTNVGAIVWKDGTMQFAGTIAYTPSPDRPMYERMYDVVFRLGEIREGTFDLGDTSSGSFCFFEKSPAPHELYLGKGELRVLQLDTLQKVVRASFDLLAIGPTDTLKISKGELDVRGNKWTLER